MAGYRQIHTSIWRDTWFIDLSVEEKLLFVYLFSNDSSTLTGIYQLSMKVMMFETGLDKEAVLAALEKFARDGKAFYEDNTVWVVNMERYHSSSSPKVLEHNRRDLDMLPDSPMKRKYIEHRDLTSGEQKQVPDTVSIPYPYPIDRVSEGQTYGMDTSSLKELKEKRKEEEEEERAREKINLPVSIQGDDETGDEQGGSGQKNDRFVEIALVLEREAGLPMSPGATNAIREMVAAGCSNEDIVAGIRWNRENKRQIRYASAVVGPAQFAMRKRMETYRKKSGWSGPALPMIGPDGPVYREDGTPVLLGQERT